MGFPLDLIDMRLFLRLLLGLILLSIGAGKLAHPHRFRQGIQDYKLLPARLDSRFSLSTVASFGIPLVELLTGFGLCSGLVLMPYICQQRECCVLTRGEHFPFYQVDYVYEYHSKC